MVHMHRVRYNLKEVKTDRNAPECLKLVSRHLRRCDLSGNRLRKKRIGKQEKKDKKEHEYSFSHSQGGVPELDLRIGCRRIRKRRRRRREGGQRTSTKTTFGMFENIISLIPGITAYFIHSVRPAKTLFKQIWRISHKGYQKQHDQYFDYFHQLVTQRQVISDRIQLT
ncbi:hypothetical protein CHS0354_013166 [Potamilus streckersoni]|uniref:Uncharacterized protein n=1 Tax=Potamilus streckersoni TaxID=2493646 RepID=A0AAE0T8Z7_9BIVA|nr:hypothetical protein CHS0354_013166 [Potamilus streckersoni]